MTIRPFQSFISKGYFTYLHSDIKNSDQPLRNRPRFSGVIILDKELRTLVARKTVSAIGKNSTYRFQRKACDGSLRQRPISR